MDPVKYLEKVRPYDGDASGLTNFISTIDTIVPTMIRYNEQAQRIFYNIINSKLTGNARIILEINCTNTTWAGLKIILNDNFGEKRNIFQLVDDLRSCS